MQCKQLTCDVQVTMSLNIPDPDPTLIRKHQRITVNFPIRIHSCQATPANIDLPAYSEGNSVNTIKDERTLPLQSPHLDPGCDSAAVQVTDRNNILVTAQHASSPPAYDSLTNGTSGR